ncbi:DUF4189 domain-containing protein [Nocardia sp. NPDC051030]|uniref:DUF4189 domain-containing protein n=1 Tax=Nocardia sp. NPDC051030 TaxID=3155162 RepID=UPI003419F61D
MSLSRKAALGVAVCAAAALFTGGMGTANAAGDLYGSFAMADLGDAWQVGVAWDAPDQARAERSALDECGYSFCATSVSWSNGCAALAARGDDVWYAIASTKAAAERNALAATGPDPNPLLVSFGSSKPSSAHIVGSQCTSNAG